LQQIPHEEPEESADDDEGSTDSLAIKFRDRLVALGPAYIKLGQVLSTRPDLLPPEYVTALKKLQDDLEPVPFADIVTVIEEELGGRMSKLFVHFDEEPLGTASLGQAHAAELRGGRAVVVKVQRPDIRESLAADLLYFHELAAFLDAHTKAGRRVDMIGIIHQLERSLADELDYRIEARNSAHFRRSLAEYPRLLVPRVVEGFSTERVLTTERVRGIKLGDVSPLTRMELDLRPVAEELTRAYLKQITIEGHFHADPHPGNVFLLLPEHVNPPSPSDLAEKETGVGEDESARGTSAIAQQEVESVAAASPTPADVDVRLGLIDFGMTARLSPTMRDLCLRMLLGLADERGNEVAEALEALGEPLPEFDRAGYVREISSIVSRNYNLSIGDMNTGHVLNELIMASFDAGLRLPAELTLLAKAMVHLDAVTRALDPTFDPMETVRAFMQEVAQDRVKTQLNSRQFYRVLSQSGELLSALPRRLDLITARLANNEFQARLDIPQVEHLLGGAQKVANRVFTGLVLAGLLVASGMLLPHRPALGTAGFLIAAGIALYMIVSILWNDRARD
jgi:predicted unusual protein kinase regulating ubiquinone biosynthesis (AarF/ABC1/UbiB family)